MITVEQLEDLESWLEEVTGPIRAGIEVSYDEFNKYEIALLGQNSPYNLHCYFKDALEKGSVDAALALAERLLPNTYLHKLEGERAYCAEFRPKERKFSPVHAILRTERINGFYHATGNTRPLAILLALVAALKENERIIPEQENAG